MTNGKRSLLKSKFEKLTCENGGYGNVALIGQMYHRCNPYKPNEWACDAVQLDGDVMCVGKVRWGHDEELQDASDYDWDFGESDFISDNEFSLTDDDELDEALEYLGLKRGRNDKRNGTNGRQHRT